MAFQSDPYAANLASMAANTWTAVGAVAAAGKHRYVAITVNVGTADTVSLHIGTAAPAGNPSLWNSLSLDDGGGKSSSPHLVTSGEGIWIKSKLGNASIRVEGFEEAN